MNSKKDIKEAVKAAYNALEDKKGIDIMILNISDVSSLGDYFVIASADNTNQLKAMADAVEENLYKQAGLKLSHAEGFNTNSWILLDFGDIIVHLFNKEDRAFYSIERIWGDAKFINPKEL